MTMIQSNSGTSLASIDAAARDRLQLLVFSATWCGPCKAMAPAIEDIAQVYADDLVVARIDIDHRSLLRRLQCVACPRWSRAVATR
jgi:thioredoxin 1